MQGAGVPVRLDGVTRRHRSRGGDEVMALDAVDLAIEPGEAVAICGPSGSGKSTLLQLVGALDACDAGRVLVDGVDLGELTAKGLTAHRRRVGFVFQSFNLLPALSVVDNVLAPVIPLGQARSRRARALELLAAVGLEGRQDDVPAELSGGQQQRVAIARALIGDPAVLIADEPTGNLDSRAGEAIVAELLTARERTGATVLIATHDAQVAGCCDRVVRLRDGRLVGDVDLRGADVDSIRERL
jgi:putative ABC transport system ATP-binding protein